MARGYVTASRADIAVLVARHGILQRVYRSDDFPWIESRIGRSVPADSLLACSLPSPRTLSEIEECEPETWLGSRAAADVEVMTEQVLGQASGFAMILLRIERNED